MTNQFIKQQQELVREYSHVKGWEIDTAKIIVEITPEELDTLIQQIITNTGEELVRRAEEERGEVGERLNTFLSGYQWGSYRTINAIESEIKIVTGVRQYYDNKSRSNRP